MPASSKNSPPPLPPYHKKGLYRYRVAVSTSKRNCLFHRPVTNSRSRRLRASRRRLDTVCRPLTTSCGGEFWRVSGHSAQRTCQRSGTAPRTGLGGGPPASCLQNALAQSLDLHADARAHTRTLSPAMPFPSISPDISRLNANTLKEGLLGLKRSMSTPLLAPHSSACTRLLQWSICSVVSLLRFVASLR